MARRRLPPEMTLQTETLRADGLGVAAYDSRRVHMRNALPGEAVTARVLRRRKGVFYADAQPLEGEPLHPSRVPPACEVYPRCGGCVLQHVSGYAQLELKQQALTDALEAHGVAVGLWRPPERAEPFGYRTKARLGVRQVGEQVLVGFRESFSNRVAKVSACPILAPRLSALIAPLKVLLSDLSIAAQVPQVEVALGDGEDEVALLLRHLAEPSARDIKRLQAFARNHRVQLLLQSKGYDTLTCILGDPVRQLSYRLAPWGLLMRYHPAQFTQVNLAMNQRLIRQVLGYLGDLRDRQVVDLFCGIGNFSLPLARRGAVVTGIEGAEDAVAKARENASLNGLAERCEFAAQDLYSDDPQLPVRVDALVVDPPRSGLGPRADRWAARWRECGAAQVVYVSCNPTTFASDAVVLQAAGYRLASVGVFDMFPHTGHVETVGHFVNEPGDG
ncbi:MAG: 23S rRNA (uracil(1939)-C(5))-methyltransferase RlmD [Pseudomonadota bacterium]